MSNLAPFHVELLSVGNLDQSFIKKWEDLVKAGQNPNPYYLPRILLSALECYAQKHNIRLLIINKRPGNSLIAIIPVVKGSRLSIS